jgi:hypothetical protein
MTIPAMYYARFLSTLHIIVTLDNITGRDILIWILLFPVPAAPSSSHWLGVVLKNRSDAGSIDCNCEGWRSNCCSWIFSGNSIWVYAPKEIIFFTLVPRSLLYVKIQTATLNPI